LHFCIYLFIYSFIYLFVYLFMTIYEVRPKLGSRPEDVAAAVVFPTTSRALRDISWGQTGAGALSWDVVVHFPLLTDFPSSRVPEMGHRPRQDLPTLQNLVEK
jgi:hypothetical protein